MDKISFQGKSQLLFSQKIYNTCCEKTERVFKHVNKEVVRQVPRFSLYTAETSSDNLILYMGNEKSGLLTTVSTTEKNPEIMENLEIQASNLLKKAKEKLTVWIIGGDPIRSNNGTNMVRTVNEVADILCDKPNIDASILAGGKDKVNKVAFKLSGGKLNVVVGNNIKADDVCEEELLRHYDIVELNNVI